MKLPAFAYHRPTTIDETLALLAEHGDDAKVLAGGQSLLPMMALRMSRPAHLVDIARVTGIDGLEQGDDGAVTIGTTVPTAVAERSDLLRDHAPAVADAVPYIGHTAIRTRGTIGGSLAHADPAAELPAVALALDAELLVRSTTAERVVPAADFFLGYLTTALEADELLTGIRLPAWQRSRGAAVLEVSRRHGDFALVGLVTALTLTDDGTVADAALSFFGLAGTPIRVSDAEQMLVGGSVDDEAFAEAARVVTATVDPGDDLHATGAYRRHVAGVLTRRGLTLAAQRAEAHR